MKRRKASGAVCEGPVARTAPLSSPSAWPQLGALLTCTIFAWNKKGAEVSALFHQTRLFSLRVDTCRTAQHLRAAPGTCTYLELNVVNRPWIQTGNKHLLNSDGIQVWSRGG